MSAIDQYITLIPQRFFAAELRSIAKTNNKITRQLNNKTTKQQNLNSLPNHLLKKPLSVEGLERRGVADDAETSMGSHTSMPPFCPRWSHA